MRGEEMWEQDLDLFAPSFVFAPSAADSPSAASSLAAQSEMLIPELIGGQSVVVYQTDSGKQIVRVDLCRSSAPDKTSPSHPTAWI